MDQRLGDRLAIKKVPAGLLAGLMIACVSVAVSSCIISSQTWEGYETAERALLVPVGDATGIRIRHEAGSLDVVGEVDKTEVSMVGTAYAIDAEGLAQLQIVTRTDGAWIVVEVETPTDTKFDLSVEIPDLFDVTIDDGSGSVSYKGIGGIVDIPVD